MDRFLKWAFLLLNVLALVVQSLLIAFFIKEGISIFFPVVCIICIIANFCLYFKK